MTTTEFAPASEVCTAVIHQAMATGEAYVGPIAIGYYNSEELFIECEGARIGLPLEHLKDIIKQIKRAEKIARESADRE